jgi:polysaccharide biosynthesis transport protein
MSHQPFQYATLGDYMRVLRRRRVLVFVIALGAAVLALGLSLTQDRVYTAQAQLQFRDPLADLNIVGVSGEIVPELAPNQRAAANAELVTRPEVTSRVRRKLDTEVSADALQAAVSGRVSPQTNLVILDASWGDPEFAAELANAYANAARTVGTNETRRRLEQVEESILAQIEVAKDDLPAGGAAFRLAALEQNLSQVRSLRDIAAPVEVAERAETPSAPVSPQPVRNTVLGAVLGLILGLVAAFLRDSLDKRFHTAQEVHEVLDVPVLGRVPERAFAHAGLARNGHPPMLESDFEPFRMLRMNLAFLSKEKPIRSVLVTSAVPGEGKTTVSMALASAAALAGQRVLLVECDLRRPTFSRRMGIARAPGLTDYLNGHAAPAAVLQMVNLNVPASIDANGAGTARRAPESAGTLVCVAAGSPVAKAPELLQGPRFTDFVAKVTKAYDLVVFDGSPLLAVADPLEVAPHVDGVLVCARARSTTKDQLRAARATLDHLPERPAGAVITGLGRGDESYEYYYGY